MKAHDLARLLLEGPDLPVVINSNISMNADPVELDGVLTERQDGESEFERFELGRGTVFSEAPHIDLS